MQHFSPSTGEVVVPLERLLKLSTKEKMVSFSSSVEELVYRTDSAIQSKTVKNRRKAEKKRKRLEKRLSESSQDDSGIASSFEDSSPWQLGGGVIIINVIDLLLTFQAKVTSSQGQREALRKML